MFLKCSQEIKKKKKATKQNNRERVYFYGIKVQKYVPVKQNLKRAIFLQSTASAYPLHILAISNISVVLSTHALSNILSYLFICCFCLLFVYFDNRSKFHVIDKLVHYNSIHAVNSLC